MKKLFKFLKPHVGAVLAIIAILIVQAYCDLSLPGYTSDIVNVGIQQGGVDTSIPKQILVEDMDKLLLFVSEKNRETVLGAYEEDSKTYEKDAYVLKRDVLKDEEKVQKLVDILGKPMLLVSGVDADSAETKKMQESMFAGMPKEMLTEDMSVYDMFAMMPEEQRLEILEQMDDKLKDMPDTMIEQAATIYVKSAYENLGVDTEKMQTNYMLVTSRRRWSDWHF